MFEKLVDKVDDFEEKLDDWISKHEKLCTVMVLGASAAVYVGCMWYYAASTRTNRQIIKALKKAMIID